jgi:hypothetical protein
MENEGIHVITFEDDASRKILSIGEFNNATTANALEVLKIAEKEVMDVNGLIQSINTDRGSQFYPNKKDKNGEEDSVFKDYLESILFYRYLSWKNKKFNLTLKNLIDHLSQIRIALVLDKTSNKSEIIVEEITSIQASLFSFLDRGEIYRHILETITVGLIVF